MADIIRKGYVDTTDGQIHFRSVAGAAQPPIVYFHQTASSSQMFEQVMRIVAPTGRRQVALDTPAFGQSYFPPVVPTTPYYVAALLEALTNLGIDEFHACGHHTGAALACEMAANHPGRIRSLTLVGPVQLTDEERASWRSVAIDPLVIQDDGSHLMKIWARVTGLDPAPGKELCHREAVDTLRAGVRWHEAYAAVFDQDFPALLARVTCPILMLCGRDDVLFPYFGAAAAARPDARSVELPGGTYVVDDFPQEVADELVALVALVESRTG